MVHPVIQLLASRPDLLAEHAAGYGALISAQANEAAREARRLAVLLAIAAVAALVGLVLTGVAAMLAGAIPPAEMPRAWLLWAVPGAAWLLALICWLASRRHSPAWSLASIREQAAADVALLRETARS